MDVRDLENIDYIAYGRYLDEVQTQLLKIGATRCDELRDQSQLSAVVFLLLRAVSLLRSMLSILEHGPLDAYDAVRRSYLETWLLAFEFRLEGSQSQAARWHNRNANSWSPNIRWLEEYVKSQGVREPLLGRDYGGLSELAHPTKSAAENSVAVIIAPLGDGIARKSLLDAKLEFERKDVPMTMYRLLWLIIEEKTGMLRLDVDLATVRGSVGFAHAYAAKLDRPEE